MDQVHNQQMRRDRSESAFSQQTYDLDIESFIDFDKPNPSPFLSTATSSSSFSTPSSPQSTPHLTQAQPAFSAPSHPYERYPQQTLPPPGITFDGDMTGTDLFVGLINDQYSDMPPLNAMPSCFYTESASAGENSMVQAIAPAMMSNVENVRAVPVKQGSQSAAPRFQRPQPTYYAGIHQEMANQKLLEEAQRRQQAAMQEAGPKDDRINLLLMSMRATQPSTASRRETSNITPHISRMKKEEEEMDEDERLLASEEGKKLSSKERRQLRNKVSARAFRSRRKEYIVQLEAEVAAKAQENTMLQHRIDMQAQQIERLESFTRTLLQNPAFNAVMDSMTAPLMQSQQTAPPAQQESVPQNLRYATTLEQPQPRRDIRPNMVSSGPEEWPLAYGGQTWNTTGVFSVELPEAPALPELDGSKTDDILLDVPFLPVADGFFAGVRNEKAEIISDFEQLSYDDDDMVDYEAPENIMDVFDEYTAPAVPQEKEEEKMTTTTEVPKNLDEMFPGTEVNLMLQRLEMIAGGEARPEDFFDVEQTEPAAESPRGQSIERKCCVQTTNKILNRAEGLYRRIGLACGN